MPRTHVILVTHTPDRLRRTLLGVACQTVEPSTIVVSCDRDDPGLREAVQAACNEFGITVELVRRAKCQHARAAQARNNAVRRLLQLDAHPNDPLLFFDGDCVPEPHAVDKHHRLLRRGEIVLGGRFELTPEQTEAFDEDALRRALPPATPTRDQTAELRRRRSRLLQQTRVRRLGLARLGFVKGHKPKVIGANFSTTLRAYAAVNGMDETYEQWAQEDDDLGRRIFQSGGRPVVGVGVIHSFHQYHPTRAPDDWQNCPNVLKLKRPAPTWCVHGLNNPLPQSEPVAERIEPAATLIGA